MNVDILLIDDDPIAARVIIGQLEDFGRPRFAASAAEAQFQIDLRVPELILLDMDMPGTGGLDLCRTLRQDMRLETVPIIFVTAMSDEDVEVRGLECGASDFIAKPTSTGLLRARVNTHLRLQRMTRQLQDQAMTDGLTGVANRRTFEATLHAETARALRNADTLSLILFDIDHFKAYNDQYGHPAGDECLRQVARALSAMARRPSDVFARYGGEEFVVLLPQTSRNGAMTLARAMLARLHELAIPHSASGVADHVTASMGVTSLEDDWRDPVQRGGNGPSDHAARLVERADQALYQAKAAGRAQVVFQPFGHSLLPPPGGPGVALNMPGLRSPADVAGADAGAEAGDSDSTVAETWPRIEGIDREQSERRLCGNRELFGTLLHSLVQQYADFEEAPIQVIAAPDIARRIHKLKGSAGTLGAMRLHDLALRTESALQRHDDQLAGALLSEVGAQLSRLRHDCASTFEGWQ